MINWKGKLMQSSIMPTVPNGKGRKIDLHTLAATIKEISRHPDQYTFIVENPGAHAPSAAGLRSMTYSFAAVETLLAAHQLKYHVVLSQKWQKVFWSKPKMPKGQKFNTKAAALNIVNQIFPGEKWLKSDRCTKPHDGMIDAALLAEYGRRQNI
jgi:hypothetical protein